MAPSLPSLALAILLIVLMSTTQLPSSLAAASESHHDLVILDRFHRWMSAHGRSYASADEKLHRLEVYRRNVEHIEASNRAGKLGYELGENIFTDLTNEEFVAMYASSGSGGSAEDDKAVGDDDMVITTLAGNVSEGHERSNIVVPVSFDWRTKGAVTSVKFQGFTCEACWAFVATALVESLVKIKGGSLVDLSEQEIIDCDTAQKPNPCQGGNTLAGVQYAQAKGGLVSETAYPYADKDNKQTCKDLKGVPRVGKITSVTRVAARNEALLATYVLQTPVSISMDATGDLQYYKSGVYKGPCTGPTNHGVVLVGWGVDVTGVKYWIAKNSWSDLWGQKGFFFMRKEADGPAGLCSMVAIGGVYPTM